MSMQHIERELKRAGEVNLAWIVAGVRKEFQARGHGKDIPLPGTPIELATRPQKEVEQPFYVIPESIGVRSTLEIGGKSVDQLEAEVKSVRKPSGYTLDMMHSPEFATLEEVTPVELIKLRVREFGLTGTPTTTQLFERATHSRIGNMALELCRTEVGPHQAIADTKQPLNDVYYIAHEPIADRGGHLRVFSLARDASGLWLDDAWALPGCGWDPGSRLGFALREIEPVKA